MQQWSVKGIKQAESMMREAKARATIWQKRTKAIKVTQEPGMMIVTCTLLFSKFDFDARKDVLSAAGRDNSSRDEDDRPDGPGRVLVDVEYTKTMVETVKRIDGENRPAPMDFGSFVETHDHAAFVQ